MLAIQAAFRSGRQDAGPRTRRVLKEVEERGRGHGEELAIIHDLALLKDEEAKNATRGSTNEGKEGRKAVRNMQREPQNGDKY